MRLHLLKWDVRPVRQCTTWWSWCLLRCVVSHPILSEIRESKKREEVKTPANRSQQTNGFQSHLMCQNQISSKSHILRICEENISVFFESKRQFRNGQGKKHQVSHQPALWKKRNAVEHPIGVHAPPALEATTTKPPNFLRNSSSWDDKNLPNPSMSGDLVWWMQTIQTKLLSSIVSLFCQEIRSKRNTSSDMTLFQNSSTNFFNRDTITMTTVLVAHHGLCFGDPHLLQIHKALERHQQKIRQKRKISKKFQTHRHLSC